MALDHPVQPVLARGTDVGKIARLDRLSLGKIHIRRTSDLHPDELAQRKPNLHSKPGRRFHAPLVDPRIRCPEPRAVVQRELQKSRLGLRILHQRRIESDRDYPRWVDLSRLALAKQLEHPIKSQEVSRQPVAVRQPYHLVLS